MSATTKSNQAGLSDVSSNELQISLDVTVQLAIEEPGSEAHPSSQMIQQWARSAFAAQHHLSGGVKIVSSHNKVTEITIRLVDKPEMIGLNRAYRGKASPTNVLSFPAELPLELIEELEIDLLGDIVICHGVVTQEAKQQQKTVADHYAHMVTHGVLHLCGYDHEDDVSANQMESLETEILTVNGIKNPYC